MHFVAVDCPADIVFVLDASSSIEADNFELVKSFLRRFVGKLDIDSGSTRVGLLTYSNDVDSSTALNANRTLADVRSAISSLGYSGGSTNTAAALEHVRTTMLTSSAGARRDVPNVVVVLTDGKSRNTTATEVRAVI